MLVRQVVSRSAVGGMVESVSHDAIFEFDLEQVDVPRWVDIGQPSARRRRSSVCGPWVALPAVG